MNFSEKLNEYMEMLGCTAKDLCDASGLSAATLSRYRSGDRVPERNTEAFGQICGAIALLAQREQREGITKESVAEGFSECPDIITTDREQFRQNFNTLISVLNMNITQLCHSINYDTSTVFRIRNGSRRPSDPNQFAGAVAGYVSREMRSAPDRVIMAVLFDCSAEELSDTSKCFETVRNWLIRGQGRPRDGVAKFLERLDEFDLNEYIKAIHFDELKVPSVPFQLPTSKTYFGIEDMMESELDFLKATVLSKSLEPVIMYSDMPMEEMSRDAEFPKKWMFGMAMVLKKGLHLNMIHNIDRPFHEMMLGLESWIPMYMTGQVSPYYLKDVQNNVFLHLIKVSGTAALSGEAIAGCHSDGKYYLTKNKDEVAYYQKRAQELLAHAQPLMNIYRTDNADQFNAFLLADSHTEGKRRSILSSLPLYTMEEDTLKRLLQAHALPESDRERIIAFACLQKQMIEEMLKTECVEDEIPQLGEEEFARYPVSLCLSGMFYETDIPYTYAEYLEHLNQTLRFAQDHPNYCLRQTAAYTFRNLQITMHEGKWVMVSKGKSPAIHFVIHHPKLRKAIENFVPPVMEEQTD